MRPIQMSARGVAAIGALGIATTLIALPDAAQSDSQGAPAAATSAPVTAVQASKPARVATGLHVRSARRNVGVDRRVVVRGTLRPSLAGKVVRLQMRRGRHWRTVARTRTRKHGAFSAHYTARRIGTYRLRLLYKGDASSKPARRAVGTVNVYRKVFVSWYGGGGAVACPGASGRATLGVAHKTLPCGTMVTLRYHGRTVRAKVIDRGPYVGGREYDLTAATKNALGTGDLATIESTR